MTVTPPEPSRGAQRRANVAAVVVCYGADERLPDCISSLARQKESRFDRVILVDNNPPGARCRPETLQSAAGPGIDLEILVPGENLGYGRAVNLALSRIREEFVLVSNPDLTLEDGALHRLRGALVDRPRAAAVGPGFASPDGSTVACLSTRPPRLRDDLLGLMGLDRAGRRTGEAGNGDLDETGEVRPVGFLSGACFLARRRAMDQIGGFDPAFFLYYEDADLFRRLADAGWDLYLVPGALVFHAHGGSWSDPVRRQAEGFRAALVYHRKHGGPGAALLFRIGLLGIYLPRLLLGGLLAAVVPLRTGFTPRQRIRMVRDTLRTAFATAGPTRTRDERPEEGRP